MKLVLLDSSSFDLLKKNIVLLRSTQEKYCFACYFSVDLSIVLSCKSEFNDYLFLYCFENVKPNFARLLVKCNFQWSNLLICFLPVFKILVCFRMLCPKMV